ncbi:MAG TPA: response regulator, partial [Candidatus Omnitrophota bacterium]|nr:response regulator [Candidatus Omnitrophota bacterium]
MDDMPHILVVDDDTRLRELLRKYLADNGYVVTVAADAGEARSKLAALEFDLIVLDVMMPGEDGLSLTRDLRKSNPVPILLLTAMSEVDDRIRGLESGADDYLPKPFEPRELLLRIASILRRVPKAEPEAAREMRFGPLTWNVERAELKKDGDMVHLTTAESQLMTILAE